MEELISFAKGPLFRFSFAVLILGLVRLVFLTIWNGLEAKKRGKDKDIPKHYVRKLTIGYILPLRAFRTKPLYSLVSILFHIGLLITPLFLFDHALLIDNSIGFSWLGLSLSKETADILTILTIITAVILFMMRAGNRYSRFLSRKQDFLWLVLLLIPFVSGLVCAQCTVNPATYQTFILIHILSGCLIFILIPVTKIAHCVLLPFGQWITARMWKFDPDGGENTLITLGKEEEAL
jgi:nitrate reductase gamma subunit